jgi:hypothetical protein
MKMVAAAAAARRTISSDAAHAQRLNTILANLTRDADDDTQRLAG